MQEMQSDQAYRVRHVQAADYQASGQQDNQDMHEHSNAHQMQAAACQGSTVPAGEVAANVFPKLLAAHLAAGIAIN